MAYFDIEQRIVQDSPFGFVNTSINRGVDAWVGGLLARRRIEGMVRVIAAGEYESSTKFKKAILELENAGGVELVYQAQNEALEKVGQERKMVYRIISDGIEDVKVMFADREPWENLSRGQLAVVIGSLAEINVYSG